MSVVGRRILGGRPKTTLRASFSSSPHISNFRSCLALLAGLDWNIAQKTGEKRFTDAHNTQMKIRIAKITLDTDTTKHAKNNTIIHA